MLSLRQKTTIRESEIMHNNSNIANRDFVKQDFIFFEDLFHVYYYPLLAFANKYTNDKFASEDIVQDVFLGLWMKRATINFSESIKPYLYKATYNRSISYLNSQVESLNLNEQNIKLQLQQKIISYDLQESLLLKEVSNEIISCVETFPEQCRKVFLLSRAQGLKNKEIAKLLNISEKTVEGHISKALSILRFHLQKLDLMPFLCYSIYKYLF